jgi:hypothetical protein
MKLLRPIDSVLLLSTALFASSCAILKFAGVGPCGPSTSIACLAIIGVPIGGLGMIIGFILSVAFTNREQEEEHNDQPG